VTITNITNGIVNALGSSSVFQQTQGGLTLTESIPETPLIQVYFEELTQSKNSQNDRISFKTTNNPIIRQTGFIFHVDVYAKARANIGEDIAKVSEVADEVMDILDKEERKPFFNTEGIKAFSYTASRVVFQYNRTKYAGIRFILDLTVF
jgi:hypothetical protein